VRKAANERGKDPEIIRKAGGSPAFEEPMPMSSDEAEAWYEQVSSDPNPLHWAIELQGRFAGTARLHSVGADRHARYAVGLLDRKLPGSGPGRQVTRLVLGSASSDSDCIASISAYSPSTSERFAATCDADSPRRAGNERRHA
jgi:hypothetical protein